MLRRLVRGGGYISLGGLTAFTYNKLSTGELQLALPTPAEPKQGGLNIPGTSSVATSMLPMASVRSQPVKQTELCSPLRSGCVASGVGAGVGEGT